MVESPFKVVLPLPFDLAFNNDVMVIDLWEWGKEWMLLVRHFRIGKWMWRFIFFKPIYSMRVLRVGVDSSQWKEDRTGNFCIKFYMVLYVVGTKSS